jgi:hypothetical protein
MPVKRQMKKEKKTLRKKSFITKAIGIYIAMILLVGVFVFVPSVSSDPADPWYNTNWNYRKEITINHSMVQSDLTDFTVLISFASDVDLAAYAQPDGDDIVFTDVAKNKLNHESRTIVVLVSLLLG